MVIYVVHKRVTVDVGSLATLASNINIFGLDYQPTLLTLLYQKTKPKKKKRKLSLHLLWTNLCLWHISTCNHQKQQILFLCNLLVRFFFSFFFFSHHLLFRHLGVQQNIYNVKFEWKWVLYLIFSSACNINNIAL